MMVMRKWANGYIEEQVLQAFHYPGDRKGRHYITAHFVHEICSGDPCGRQAFTRHSPGIRQAFARHSPGIRQAFASHKIQ